MTTELNVEIRELVRERYAEVARGASDCCGDSCCDAETNLYTLQEVDGLPTEAVMASAGCGNPHGHRRARTGRDGGGLRQRPEASTASWRREP